MTKNRKSVFKRGVVVHIG